nr:Chain P, VMAPRTLIL peptide from CMV gpUL40 [synthetic construct]5W1V_C Chain C, VMAPRTLIL peptide from CMV gpUL40 [Human herpesvirus 5 strain AD169]5W1V_H Chain H, VMAPRTLIL peptide from CMV gpUL40 [Human herpesvirus 5 strain AD169]5W1V_M Chain M, VMAPRTLIL peptide from CMV gpUL40 [Human herpesvirus 5 strain AD169]5W1V_R Chain R, VMAPRTLIL peptide from CMV gpUL40 [Human herpesvirus 5 strain AD169]
VMAPRTLIL